MSNRISRNEVDDVNQKILQAVSDTSNTVSSLVKSSFYFKGRKSIEIAEKVIRALSGENDLILDPFLGGGSFLIAALDSDRYIDTIELDNYTYYALEMQFKKYNHKLLLEYFEKIKKTVKKDIFYLVKD